MATEGALLLQFALEMLDTHENLLSVRLYLNSFVDSISCPWKANASEELSVIA